MKINPVVFSDGEQVYKDLSVKYIKHSYGLFILAPSGAGKTYFCNNQNEQHWIDGDALWMKAKAHPDGPWWNEPIEVINRIDKRSDVITMEAMVEGFWIMGASNYWLEPSAIVLPDWEDHKAFITNRQENNYDGGATSEDYAQVLGHREAIEKWHTEHNVPSFKTIDEAVRVLTARS